MFGHIWVDFPVLWELVLQFHVFLIQDQKYISREKHHSRSQTFVQFLKGDNQNRNQT